MILASEDTGKSSNSIQRQTLQDFLSTRRSLCEAWQQWAARDGSTQGFSAAQGSLASRLSCGFDLLLFFKELCVLILAHSRAWDLSHRMWLRRKKNHLIGMMRKNKRHFAPPAVFQPLTLVHFVGLICWSCCKIREAGTLLYFVFAECSVQVHPLLSWFLLVVIMVMIKSYRQQHWKEREKLSLEEPLACLACGLLFPMSFTALPSKTSQDTSHSPWLSDGGTKSVHVPLFIPALSHSTLPGQPVLPQEH